MNVCDRITMGTIRRAYLNAGRYRERATFWGHRRYWGNAGQCYRFAHEAYDEAERMQRHVFERTER